MLNAALISRSNPNRSEIDDTQSSQENAIAYVLFTLALNRKVDVSAPSPNSFTTSLYPIYVLKCLEHRTSTILSMSDNRSLSHHRSRSRRASISGIRVDLQTLTESELYEHYCTFTDSPIQTRILTRVTMNI